MILTKSAILAIKGSSGCKSRLSKEFGVSMNTVYRWIKDNEPDGDLTKARAIMIVSEETGIEKDQILESESLEAAQN